MYFCSAKKINMTKLHKNKKPSAIGGTMIIAGTLIGGGMIAIPIAASGLWYFRTLFILVYTWFCMSCAGLMVLEANLHYKKGASFDTMVKDLLGRNWNIITGLTITFVLYTLVYAYITVGGGITNSILEAVSPSSEIPHYVGGLLFCFILAFCVWISTKAIDRASTILIIAMAISFIAMITGLLNNIDYDVLSNHTALNSEESYWPYAFFILPVCVTSFCFHSITPSLTLYYNKDAKKISKSIIIGSIIALVAYTLWVTAIHGNLPREEFLTINNAEDNVQEMMDRLNSFVSIGIIKKLINFFTYAAIISSFLGASLGLFDYLANLFKIQNTKLGRLKTASITFLPPLIASFVFPYGFVVAISYVGFAAAIWSIIVPALMVLKSRKRFPNGKYKVFGGKPLVYFILLFAIITLLAQLITQFGLVKSFSA